MKILHIATGYPLSYQGGITNYVRSLASYQSDLGHDITVLGGMEKQSNNYNFNYIEFSSKLRPFSLQNKRDDESLEFLKKLIATKQFDIIHFHMILDVDRDLYRILKNEKYIVSLHDYFYLCPRITMLDKNRHLCVKIEMQKCSKCVGVLEQLKIVNRLRNLKFCNKLITSISIPSDYTKIRLNSYKLFLEKATLLLPVSNRVKEIYELSEINNNSEVLHIGNITAENSFNADREWNDNKIMIGFIGNLTYHKGAELLIEIAKKNINKHIEFHVYGGINKEYLLQLSTLGVYYHGAYTQSEMNNIMKNIDIGIVLSIWEDNAPQVVMEFLNFNKPVIATRMGGIPDFINEKNGFLFSPHEQKELDNLIYFLEKLNYDKIVAMKKEIKKTKTPSEHALEIIDIYRKELQI